MQLRKEKVKREIEAAAVRLGFRRRVSYPGVLRELQRCFSIVESKHNGRTPKGSEMTDLDYKTNYARFCAVASLACLIDAVRNVDRKISTIRKDAVECAKRTRKLVAIATRAAG
jgi:hypothetical protein